MSGKTGTHKHKIKEGKFIISDGRDSEFGPVWWGEDSFLTVLYNNPFRHLLLVRCYFLFFKHDTCV